MKTALIAIGAAVAIAALVSVGACSVVAIKEKPAPPSTYTFVDPHRRPRAYGGGRCPIAGRHTHVYPPIPPAAFVKDGDAFRERDVDDVDDHEGAGHGGVDAGPAPR